MTETEIDKLQAGQELDELILKYVFKDSIGDDGRGSRMAFFDQHRYSADIAAAWQVVEKLRAKGLYIASFGNGSGLYGCTFARASHDWKPEWTGEGATAPLAICRAALKAVSAKKQLKGESHGTKI